MARARSNKEPHAPPTFEKVMAHALRMLNQRAFSTGELRARLAKRCEDQALLDQVVERLVELRYLGDETYAAEYARARVRMKPIGRRRLSMDMARRKLAPEIVESTLDEVYEEVDESGLIAQAINKWVRVKGEPTTPRARQRLIAHPARRGFSFGDIRDVLDSREAES